MNMEKITPAPGQPVVHGDMANPDRTGYIATVTAHENRVFTIGAGGMERERFALVIVWESGGFTEISEGIATRWIDRAATLGIPGKSESDVLAMLADAETQQAREREAQRIAADAHAQRVSDWRDSIRDKVPADAKAVIVAELVHDRSDSQSDYWGSTTSRTIILAFSAHTRDIFSEMRKAARNNPATAHLADAPASAEHRQKYSMGGGYFLKEDFRHSDGWKVSKQTFYGTGNDIAARVPYGEWSVPDASAAPEVKAPRAKKATDQAARPAPEACDIPTPEGFHISTHTHSKKGFAMWIVEIAERVERETFMAWLEKAKGFGGWYSRAWAGTPAGYAFKSEDGARKFLEAIANA